MNQLWRRLTRLFGGTALDGPSEIDCSKSRILSTGTRSRPARGGHVAPARTGPAVGQGTAAPSRTNGLPPQCQTLNALHAFNAKRGPGEASLADVGLELLPRLERRCSEKAPAGALVFAQTGGDSVHFCLIP